MRPVRRLFVSIGAPLILVLGVGVAWGVRKGSTMVREIERWSESLENTADPVELRVSGFPIISTMYLDGAKIGKLDFPDTIVFDNTIQSVSSLRNGRWELPAKASWHARAFSLV